MDRVIPSPIPAGLRWLVAPTTLLLSAALISLLFRSPAASPMLLHLLSLLLIATATYACVLYPLPGALTLGALAALCLQGAWAMRPSPLQQQDALAFLLLAFVVGWERRRRWTRLQRMEQVVDDLREEGVVKEQAVGLAAQAQEALQKKHGRYLRLQSIAEELSNMTDLASIGRLVVERAFSLIGKSDVCLLFLLDTERQELSLFASKRRESLPAIRSKHGDQFDRHVVRTHRPLLVNDTRRDFRFTVTLSAERPISSVIACPLLLGQSPEGVLRLDSAQPGAYSQDDLRLLDILLHLVATAVTNARLFAQTERLAVTDGLTGLMMRRPFLEQLARELARSQRGREPASVLMLDVDEFKGFNDQYGHTAGDLVLKAIGNVLRTAVPPGGAIARYGGEEFAVLLPRLPREQARDIAERIRRVVAEQVHAPGRGTPRRVTVSVGVASFPEDAQAELELIRVADQRLYQAKGGGRNLVCAG